MTEEVPCAPPFACGLINVRGRVVPLADLKVAFGMPASEQTDDTRIVVIESEIEGEPRWSAYWPTRSMT